MCVFCAALPAAAAVGSHAKAKQLRKRREAEQRGDQSLDEKQISVGMITTLVVGALVVASITYHSHFYT